MKIRYASLVSPRGMYGTKYHDVVLKRDVKRFLTDLKKQINLKLGEDKNNSNYEEMWGDETSDFFDLIDELAGASFHGKTALSRKVTK